MTQRSDTDSEALGTFSLADADNLLYGSDATTSIVAIEPDGNNRMLLYRRLPNGVVSVEQQQYRPWIVTSDNDWARNQAHRGAELHRLDGTHPRNVLVSFPGRSKYRRATDDLDWSQPRWAGSRNPVVQFLLATGMTFFKTMEYRDVVRMQLDIETLGLDPEEPDAAIIMVAVRQGDREDVLMLESDEAALFEKLNTVIADWDPDVIEGHNIFNFDLPFLVERARRAGTALAFGRDGSPPFVSTRQQRFRSGPQSLPFTSVTIHGRHVIDTYQQIQRWDVTGRLAGYGLKPVITALGLERPDRVFIAGESIADRWRSGQRGKAELADYALDDVRDVNLLSEITLPTEFYQTQIVPMPYQRSSTAGSGTKIDHLMMRAYLARGHSLPVPQHPRAFPGGYVELVTSGVFGPVVKCDVESLYPSIMIQDQVRAEADVLGAFTIMLETLTNRRIEAKRTAERSTGSAFALWNGLQGSFKILVNSFYGYLGFGRGSFNDFDAAEDVTLRGQRIIQDVVRLLGTRGATCIEVDTDGVYFMPPEHILTEDQELAFVASISEQFPGRIRLAHDGRYRRMLSLKIKNYALLGYDDGMSMIGSSLRSRRMERCFRTFIEHAARGFMEDQRDAVREAYFTLAAGLQARNLDPSQISQWTMLRRSTIDTHARLKTLMERHPGRARFGERVETYERDDGALGFIEDYARDENATVMLRRLHEAATRFVDLFPDLPTFDAFFPSIGPTTNLDIARTREVVQQMGLFD